MNSKKTDKKQILLSVVALLVILLVGVGVTFSWIEGGTTYSMETEHNEAVNTGSVPESVKFSGKVILNPDTSTSKLSLTDYDETSNQSHQSLYFAPVSSADGQNFYFPTAYGESGQPVSYRESTTNDIGTKYINFDFDIEAASKCYLAFNGKPTITATKSGSTVADTSAFRIMITDGDITHIFSTADTKQTSTVVTDVNGTTTTLTTETFDSYLRNENTKNRLFNKSYDAAATGNIKVAVWLDSDAAQDSELFGCEVTIDLNLIVDQPKYLLSFDAVTYTNADVKETNGFKGGSITLGTSHSSAFTYAVVEDSEFSAKAVPATNYEFVGWYSDAECTEELTSSVYLTKTPTSDTSYYAKFKEKPKYTITVGTYTLPSGTGGTVTVGGSGTTYEGYQDTTTIIKATASSGYSFLGWYTDSTCSGTKYSGSTSEEVEIGEENVTYYAKFAKNYTINIYTVTDGTTGGDGGYVNIGATPTAVSASETAYYGSSVNLYARANEGYELKDIQDSSDNSIGTKYPTSVTVTGAETYYAYFEKLPASTTTIYVQPRSGYSTYSIWAYQKVGTTTTHYSGDTWPGNSAALDSTTGYYKYEFTTTDTGTFNVVISNNGGSQYPASGVEGLEGTLGGTYLFTSDNKLIEFNPDDMITVKVTATPSSYGTVTVNGGSSAKILSGDSVTLTATPSTGYDFVGWYTNSGCTTKIDSTYEDPSKTYTVTATAGSTVTYYAKFVKVYTAKAIAVTDGTSSSSTGGTVQVTGGSAGATSSASVTSGTSVTFTAVAKSGYNFTGWFTSASSTSATSTSSSYSVSITAAKTLYAKFEKIANTLEVGVISYQKSNITQVYYWCDDGTTGTIDLTKLTATTRSYSVGSSYWSNEAKTFYCYTIEVPDNVTGIKFKNSSDNWYGSNVTSFVDGKIDLIFEYGGNYINYRATY